MRSITQITLALGALMIAFAPLAQGAEAHPAELKKIRVRHAKELLGDRYSKSVVKRAEQVSDEVELRDFVETTLKTSLPLRYIPQAKRIASAVFAAAKLHQFDPFFLLAVIEHESGFDPETVGTVGEIGLMQIRLTTGEEVAHQSGIRWQGKHSLYDPVTNIRLGAAYLARLRDRFDSQGGLYLAAYNMGSRNLQRNLDQQHQPKEYAIHVMKCYLGLYARLNDLQTSKTDRVLASAFQ